MFESYPEDWIERKCERLADHGWHLSEAWGSTSKHGLIEATHELAVFKDISPDVMRAIVAVKRSTDRLHLEKARHFAKGVLMRAARVTIDNRPWQPTKTRFRDLLFESYDSMLEASIKFAGLRSMRNYRTECQLLKCDMTTSRARGLLEKRSQDISLVLTSPPYPGISVLYKGGRFVVESRSRFLIG